MRDSMHAALRLVVLGMLAAVRPVAAADGNARLLVGDVAFAADAGPEFRAGPTLDLYGSGRAEGPKRPVVLFIHGGGWRHGDKANVREKPAGFVSQGYLFASTNYRLAPHGLEPADLAGVVLLDGAGYDVPRQMAAARMPMLNKMYEAAFGDDPEFQREASPITHVAKGRRYPPFLFFHAGQRPDSREQAAALAERLRAAGGEATTIHEPDKNHMTINRELGTAGDGPTEKIYEFLEQR